MEQQQNTPASTNELEVRRAKLAALQAAGQDPFEITKYDVTDTAQEIAEHFEAIKTDVEAGITGKTVRIAGRMMSRRIMGKASFVHLMDGSGQIQLYVRRDDIGEEPYAAFKKLDVGDIIGVEGFVFRTKTGEISVHAQSLTLLAKSLLPLPEKYHGLTDTDTRYRQRYVDLIANPEVKETFVKRSLICGRSDSIWTTSASSKSIPRFSPRLRSAPPRDRSRHTTTRSIWICSCVSRRNCI